MSNPMHEDHYSPDRFAIIWVIQHINQNKTEIRIYGEFGENGVRFDTFSTRAEAEERIEKIKEVDIWQDNQRREDGIPEEEILKHSSQSIYIPAQIRSEAFRLVLRNDIKKARESNREALIDEGLVPKRKFPLKPKKQKVPLPSSRFPANYEALSKEEKRKVRDELFSRPEWKKYSADSDAAKKQHEADVAAWQIECAEIRAGVAHEELHADSDAELNDILFGK